MKLQRKRFCLAAFSALVGLAGCSSGSGPAAVNAPGGSTGGRGAVQVTIHWPQVSTSRLIPAAAKSIDIEIFYMNSFAGEERREAHLLVPRPTTGNTTTVTIPNLPQGDNYSETATAYPNADGTGQAQATGSIAGIKVLAGQLTTTPDLTMNTTITSVVVAPSAPALTVGASAATLTAAALDAKGNIVLTVPGNFHWTTDAATLLTLTPNGATASVQGKASGTAQVTVRETESGVASSPIPVTIAPASPITIASGIIVVDSGNARLVGLDKLPTTNFATYDDSVSGTKFYGIQSAAFDTQGRIYIADYPRRLVRIDDLTGKNRVTYTPPGSSGSFVYVDKAGHIYYRNDEGTLNRIDDMSGANLVSFGSSIGTNSLGNISGIVTDSQGRIYVFDGSSQIIRFDDMTGKNLVRFGTRGSGVNQFDGNYTNGIAIDSQDRLYIADANNHRIVRIDDMTGANWTTFVIPATSPAALPIGVAVETGTNPRIYFTDRANAAVYRMDDMSGANLLRYGSAGSGTAQFQFPNGIAVK